MDILKELRHYYYETVGNLAKNIHHLNGAVFILSLELEVVDGVDFLKIEVRTNDEESLWMHTDDKKLVSTYKCYFNEAN